MPKLSKYQLQLITAAIMAGLLSALVLATGLSVAAGLSKREASKLDLPAREAQKARKLGRAQQERPVCTKDEKPPCQVQASVTGFQMKAKASRQNMFRVGSTGKIVGWGVQVSSPSAANRQALKAKFKTKSLGGGPTARLAILNRTKGSKYKLLRQSPLVDLNSFYGQTPIFTLGEPLRVPKGGVVGLTTPTWISNFVPGGIAAKQDTWRASRAGSQEQCGNSEAAGRSKPLQKVGHQRRFGCTFSSRIIYYAYFVSNKGKKERLTAKPVTLGDKSVAPKYSNSSEFGSGGVAP